MKEYFGILYLIDLKFLLRYYDYGKKLRFLKLIILFEYVKMLFYDVLLNVVWFIYNYLFLMCLIFVKRVLELLLLLIRIKCLIYLS